LQFCSDFRERVLFDPLTHPLTHPYLTSPFFLNISLSLQKLQNKKQKTKKNIDRVGFGGFAVSCTFAKNML